MPGYSFISEIQLTLLNLWDTIIGVLPKLIGAFIIVVIGLIISPIIGGVVKKIIDFLKIDEFGQKMGVHDLVKGYSDNFSISLLIGKIVKWFFIIAFLMAAAEILEWEQVSVFLNQIIYYIPQVLIAIIFIVAAIIAGTFFETVVTKSLKGSNAPINRPEILGSFTKWAFMIFGIFAALVQLGIAEALITILFGGFVLAVSLAFGLGGRKKAEEVLDLIKVSCNGGTCGTCTDCTNAPKKKVSRAKTKK